MGFYLSGGHDETLKAAAEVLRSGGNAFDAAIAAFAATFVAEPAMSSAGGGGFAICSKNGEEPLAFDFFSAKPRKKPSSDKINIQPVEVHFGDETEIYFTDMGSIAIPGAIRGIFAMHRTYGTMPLNELFHHAIELAKEGVALNDFQNLDLNLLKDIFKRSEYARSVFFNKEMKVKPVGSIIALPELADFLEVLAIEGEDLFYRGEVGRKLIEDCSSRGGVLDAASLAAYQSRVVSPMQADYGGNKIYTMPYPSLGGPLLVWLTREQQKLNWDGVFRSKNYMKNMEDLLIEGRRLQNNPKDLYAHFGMDFPPGDNKRGSTTHFNILDKDLNAVSLTTTIGEGSGYFIPGTGIHMNNMLGEPGLLPNGINSWTPNALMRSMMTPTIVLDDNRRPLLLMGTGGAVRIPFMIAEVLYHAVVGGCDIQEAINRPRMFFDDEILQIESSFDLSDKNTRTERNHWSDHSLFFGGVHAVYENRATGSYEAYGDRRRDGVEWVEE